MSSIAAALGGARTQHGDTLDAVNRSTPLLLVFLRHFGCALCREMVADVARHRESVAASGAAVVFVHMHPESKAVTYFAEYGLGEALRVSDPEQRLYEAFGLSRVRPTHWLSWSIVGRYIDAIFRGGHRPGYVGGDVLQMPGAFLVRAGAVVSAFRPDTVSARFDVVAFIS
jgi:peroxiredoxin